MTNLRAPKPFVVAMVVLGFLAAVAVPIAVSISSARPESRGEPPRAKAATRS